MTPPDHPADLETFLERRTDADRSLVVQVAAEPNDSAGTAALERVCAHLHVALADAERIAVTDPEAGHRMLESASPGSLLIVERRRPDLPDGAWGPLVTLFANARYRGVHVALLTPHVPTLVRRALNVRIELTDDGPRAALLEAASDDPERTAEIDLGPL
jgi:hypothetical protein